MEQHQNLFVSRDEPNNYKNIKNIDVTKISTSKQFRL